MDRPTKARARDKLRMLNGDPPYNGGSNICLGDPYFASSIVREFGMPLEDLAKKCGYKAHSKIVADDKAVIRRLRGEVARLTEELERAKKRGRIVDRIDV